MNRSRRPEHIAYAYLSRVVQGPSRAVADFVAEVGAVAAADAIRSGSVPAPVAERTAARAHIDTAVDDLDLVESMNGRLITPVDDDWPAWRMVGFAGPGVASRSDACVPLALWAVGTVPVAQATDRAVAVVGTRAATLYGEHVGGEIAGDLALDGWTVVSGGAFGIDGVAHRAALGVGGITIAVLACGVDRAYPAGHARLLTSIGSTGLVASEYAPGTAPAKHRFLSRNRLVAGLTDATVVVEAGWRSGARNTAGWARSLGRPVLAVPGPVTSASSAGCHRMIAEGEAHLVTGARDVVSAVSPSGAADEQDALFGRPVDRLSEPAAVVLDALPATGSRGPFELSESSGLPLPAVRSALVLLEMEGLVGRDDTGWHRLPG